MRQWFKNVVAQVKKLGKNRSASQPQRRARLELEALEDRLVPTVVFIPKFGAETVSGQNIALRSPHVDVIFSGPSWTQTSQGQQDLTTLSNSVQNILSGPYLTGLKQYGSDGLAVYSGNWTDSTEVSTSVSQNYANNPSAGNTALATYVSNSIAKNHKTALPTSLAPIYVVISDTNVQANGGYGGFNAHPNMNLIWVSTSTATPGGSVNKDQFMLYLSHELAECISDPNNGIQATAPSIVPSAWVKYGSTNQICDFEPNQGFYSSRLGGPSGDLVQAYWSRADNAYIVPDGNTGNTYQEPIWSGTTFYGSVAPPIQINSIVEDAKGDVFALNAVTGVVYESTQGSNWNWTLVGSSVSKLVSDAKGNVFALNPTTAGVYEYVQGQGFVSVGSSVTSLVSDAAGNVFALNPTAGVYEHTLGAGANWTNIYKGASSLVSDATGNVFWLDGSVNFIVPGTGGNVYEHNLGGGAPTLVGSGVSRLVSDATGNVFALNPSTGGVYEHTLGAGASWPLVKSDVSSLVSDVIGNVFALDPSNGNVYEHTLGSGANWGTAPVGWSVSTLVSDATGNVFALNPSTGGVYEHTLGAGASWPLVFSSVSTLSSDSTGNVFAMSYASYLYQHVQDTGWDWVNLGYVSPLK